jgi:hypothetical protein
MIDGNGTLTVYHAGTEDTGLYKCKAGVLEDVEEINYLLRASSL